LEDYVKTRIFWRTAVIVTIGAAAMLPVIASADDGDDNTVSQPPEQPAPPPIEQLYPQYDNFLNLVDRADDAVLTRAYNGNFPQMPQPDDSGN
jgi:hypothetical protein